MEGDLVWRREGDTGEAGAELIGRRTRRDALRGPRGERRLGETG